MKKQLLAALAAVMLLGAATPALARDYDRHDRHDRWDNSRHSRYDRDWDRHRHYSGTRIVVRPSWVTGTRYYTVARPIYYPQRVYTPVVYHSHYRGCSHW